MNDYIIVVSFRGRAHEIRLSASDPGVAARRAIARALAKPTTPRPKANELFQVTARITRLPTRIPTDP